MKLSSLERKIIVGDQVRNRSPFSAANVSNLQTLQSRIVHSRNYGYSSLSPFNSPSPEFLMIKWTNLSFLHLRHIILLILLINLSFISPFHSLLPTPFSVDEALSPPWILLIDDHSNKRKSETIVEVSNFDFDLHGSGLKWYKWHTKPYLIWPFCFRHLLCHISCSCLNSSVQFDFTSKTIPWWMDFCKHMLKHIITVMLLIDSEISSVPSIRERYIIHM